MIRYVVWCPVNRPGEFEFLCSTQKHWTAKKAEALKAAEELVKEQLLGYDPPLTREDALEELGGEPCVYKLTIERIK